jgi:hypothetical protein
MYHKIWFTLLVSLALLLAACTRPTRPGSEPSTPQPDSTNVTSPPGGESEDPRNPYSPGKGDESLQRGPVYIDYHEILTLESFPPQFRLHVKGSLPTPCHELRAVVDNPDDQNRIQVQVFSLFNPDTACTQVLQPFDASIPLGRDFKGTSYTVYLNGEKVEEIKPIPAIIPLTPSTEFPTTPTP